MDQFLKVWSIIRRSRIWRDTSLLMLANLIVLALGLVRLPVITRLLSKDEVGMIGLVASVLPFLQLLSFPGLDGATYHYVAKGYATAFQLNIATRLRWSILSILGFLLVGLYWLRAGNVILAWLFTIAGLTVPATIGLTAVAGVLAARENFGYLFWYRIGGALTRYVGLGLLLLLPWLSTQVIWFSAANKIALATLQVTAAIWLINRLREENAPAMSLEKRQEVLSYGRHLTVLGTISAAQTRLDALLVGWLLPLSVMADYLIAQFVYTQFKHIWTVYFTSRYPPLVRLPVLRRRRQMMIEMGVVWIVFIPLGLALGAGIVLLVPIILPREYFSSVPLINWLLAAFVAGIPGFFAEMYFRTQQDERSLYLLRGTATISGVVIPTLFIIFWQAHGVVVGRFVTNLILSAIGVYLFLNAEDKDKVKFGFGKLENGVDAIDTHSDYGPD